MKTWFKNLSEYIQALKSLGEIKIIDHQVSAEIEISRWTDAESKSPGGGKALFFSKVAGSDFPVATNLFGSRRRICLALGVQDLDELGGRIKRLMNMPPPRGWRDMVGVLPELLSLTRVFPRKYKGRRPPCQEVVHTGLDVDLTRLPILKCWPKDAGRFITLPLVITRSLSGNRRNVGMYRMQVFDKNTTGMHWHIHKDGASFYQEYVRAGQRMPVAVAIGADPATIYAATAPLPRNIDELLLAGFIRQKPVPLVRGLTCDLEVPAEAEFILEGYVDPGELRWEGPFGDHTGYYSLADDYPVFHVTAVTHRYSPIYAATLVGRPPMEDCYLALATERLFLPLLQAVFPEIEDYWLPWEGVFHNAVVVAVDKTYPRQAQKVMHGLWGQGQMSYCKTIVVVDGGVNLRDPSRVMEQLITTLDPSTDLTVVQGMLDVLDHSAPTPLFGSKIGLDLTSRCPQESPRAAVRREEVSPVPEPVELVRIIGEQISGVVTARFYPPTPPSREQNWIIVLGIEKTAWRGGREVMAELRDHQQLKPFNIVVLLDARDNVAEDSLVWWKVFNQVDPDRDVLRTGDRIIIDATVKGPGDGHFREWPEELTFD